LQSRHDRTVADPTEDPLVLRVPDPSLVVLVGAAGAGKSSFARRHFAPDEILSSDAFRLLVAGAGADEARIALATRPAFAALHRALTRRLAEGRLTVIDATSVQPHARRALLSRAVATAVPAAAIVLDLPAEVVLARNAARTGAALVPEEAVRAQLADLSRTLAREPAERWRGFAVVHHLSTAADVDRAIVERLASGGRPPRDD